MPRPVRSERERSEELAAADPAYKRLREFSDELQSLLARAHAIGHPTRRALDECAAEAAAHADAYLAQHGRGWW